jgi:sporulation protein YlmC with PRC-barrel domain
MTGERMDVGFDLLDRQVLDRDGLDVGKVDDVEFGTGDDGTPYLTALLVGPQALGPRIGGRLGRLVTSTARRLRMEPAGPLRIPYDLVSSVGPAISLTVSRDLLVEPVLERWLRDQLIARIPGSGHEQ